MTHWLSVLVQTPAHSMVAGPLTYRSDQALVAGTLVRVPFGKRETMGVVWGVANAPDEALLAQDKIRPLSATLDGIAPLRPQWRDLIAFTARYYQRSLGEVALAALPPQLRDLQPVQLARRVKRQSRSEAAQALPSQEEGQEPTHSQASRLPTLSPEQSAVLAQIETQPGPFLLFGTTGSGKTEVYLRCVQA